MFKRIIAITTLCILLSAPISYGAGLSLVKSYPADGAGGFEPVNMMVKLFFSENVSDEKSQLINKNAFKFTDSTGKKVKFQVLFNEKDKNMISLLVGEDLMQDTEYKVIIAPSLASANSNIIGTGQTLTFKTRNVSQDMNISMVLMVVMVGGMVLFTSFDAKKKAAKAANAATGKDKMNPYKEAKRTNTTVDKVIAKEKKGPTDKGNVKNAKSAPNAENQQGAKPKESGPKKFRAVKKKLKKS